MNQHAVNFHGKINFRAGTEITLGLGDCYINETKITEDDGEDSAASIPDEALVDACDLGDIQDGREYAVGEPVGKYAHEEQVGGEDGYEGPPGFAAKEETRSGIGGREQAGDEDAEEQTGQGLAAHTHLVDDEGECSENKKYAEEKKDGWDTGGGFEEGRGGHGLGQVFHKSGHGNESAEIFSGGIGGAGNDGAEAIAELGPFGDESLGDGLIGGVGRDGVRDVGVVVFEDEVEFSGDAVGEEGIDFVSLSGQGEGGREAFGGVGGEEFLGFVVEAVGVASAHEGDDGGKVAGLQQVEPGVVGLGFGDEGAGAVGEPGGVMAGSCGGLDVKAGQLPGGIELLEDESGGLKIGI